MIIKSEIIFLLRSPEDTSSNSVFQNNSPSSSSSTENLNPTIKIVQTVANSPTPATPPHSSSLESDAMKRAAAKKLIERYFYQLLDGCGNTECKNKNCASSGEVRNLTPDQAAAKALQLYSEDAKLCDVHPTKVARTRVEAAGGDQIVM